MLKYYVCYVSAQTPCPGTPLPAGHPINYIVDAHKVTKIVMCSVTWGDFDDCICGFNLFINGNDQGRKGCGHGSLYNPYADIVFVLNEVVLAVRKCFQHRSGYLILNEWIIETNMRSIGPTGRACTASYYAPDVGHTLTGFSGKGGYAIDSLAVNFHRCAP